MGAGMSEGRGKRWVRNVHERGNPSAEHATNPSPVPVRS